MKWLHAAVALLVGAAAVIASDDPRGVKDFSLPDAQGKQHSRAEWQGKKAVVLFVLNTECPVSNFYAPEYGRLAQAFAGKGVLFYGIHPDPDLSAAAAAQHAAEYRLPFPVLLDPTQVVTRQTGVERVPSAVVLSPAGRILYRGRIDDRYTAEGVRREVPSTRDLENALRAVTEGKLPSVTETKAFGCPLPEPRKSP